LKGGSKEGRMNGEKYAAGQIVGELRQAEVLPVKVR
jgi:hypothetical protein